MESRVRLRRLRGGRPLELSVDEHTTAYELLRQLSLVSGEPTRGTLLLVVAAAAQLRRAQLRRAAQV